MLAWIMQVFEQIGSRNPSFVRCQCRCCVGAEFKSVVANVGIVLTWGGLSTKGWIPKAW
jgi:hypothetical protein